MHYLRNEFYKQRRAEERPNEAQKKAEELDTDSTFFAPSLEKYSTHSVVDLLTAACLVSGINPEHLVMRRDWHGVARYGTGKAAEALKRLMDFHTFALNQAQTGELATVGGRHELSLLSFAKWASGNNVALPKGFPTTTRSETAIARNANRYQMCIDAGLPMPQNTYGSLPRGVGLLAKRLNISTQAFSTSVKAHIATLQR